MRRRLYDLMGGIHEGAHAPVGRLRRPLAVVALSAAFFLAGELYLSYAERLHRDTLRREAGHLLAAASDLLEVGLDAAATQVCLAAQGSAVRAYLAHPGPDARATLTEDLSLLAANLRDVDQVRLLDEAGLEVIRVDRGDTGPVLAATLQDQSHRPYVRSLRRTAPGHIFTSPLDLNVENHAVEVPFKPVLRVGTPIATAAGVRRGGLVLNWRMGPLLAQLRRLGAEHGGQVQLLERDGYWLSAPDPSLEFGWQVPARRDANFAVRHPEVWSSMSAAREARSADGLFFFRALRPRRLRSACGGDRFAVDGARAQGWWLVVEHGPLALAEARAQALRGTIEVLGPLYVVCLACLLLWCRYLNTQRHHRAELEALAHTDPLTGLATRRSLEQALRSEARRARRHGRSFGLVYLDLDGFKAINDGLGHAAGDQVLIAVASALLGVCRDVDLPARLGGDEFVVLVSEVSDRAALSQIAERLLARIQGLRFGAYAVGASVGVALGPHDGGDRTEDLLEVADEAMYRAKRLGKNRVCGPLAALESNPRRTGGPPVITRAS